jgi:hypothetical protein
MSAILKYRDEDVFEVPSIGLDLADVYKKVFNSQGTR